MIDTKSLRSSNGISSAGEEQCRYYRCFFPDRFPIRNASPHAVREFPCGGIFLLPPFLPEIIFPDGFFYLDLSFFFTQSTGGMENESSGVGLPLNPIE